MNIPEGLVEPLINGGFTLLGALIGILGTLWIARKTKDKKSLTLLTSPLAKLIAVGDIIKPRVKILYNEKPIDTLWMGEFAVQNSGNLSVEAVKIDFRQAPDTGVLGFQLGSANFQLPEKRILIDDKGTGLEISVTFLNPGDRISFSYLSTGKEAKPIIDICQPGIDVKVQPEMVNWIPDIYAEVIFGMISSFWWLDLILRRTRVYKLYRDSRKKK